MSKIGIISYNIYANFTNYGSALQTWALYNGIKKHGNGIVPILINYCPDILKDKDPLNPMKNMWDADATSKKMCELSLPAIRINYYKFMNFYNELFEQTKIKYTSNNFNEIIKEGIDAFVCGSDTIFCIDEFGFDDGYYSNYEVMKEHYSFSYAASFGDAKFDKVGEKEKLYELLNNFNAIGVREDIYIPEIRDNVPNPSVIQRVIDPTLLLEKEDYISITKEYVSEKKYILLYARRYNKKMEEFAEKMSKEHNLEIIEISLRATNASKHKMFYEAGVEEFLGLVKNAECVITNSFHGIIFAIQFRKEFYGFSREQCGNKIYELLLKFGIEDRLLVDGCEMVKEINYDDVHSKISTFRNSSIKYLVDQLEIAKKS